MPATLSSCGVGRGRPRPLVSGLCLALLCYGARPLLGQDSLPPWEGGRTFSLGQPSRTTYHAGASLGIDWRAGSVTAPATTLLAGVDRAVGNPVIGRLAVTGEVYAGLRSDQADGGLRVLLRVPAFRLWLGGDYNLRDNRIGGLVGATVPLRRGGIVGKGSVLRAEWNPGGLSAARISLLMPLGSHHAGRTRPRSVEVDLPPTARVTAPLPTPRLGPAVAAVDQAARRLAQVVVPPIDQAGPDPRAALAGVLADLRGALDGPGGEPREGTGSVTLIRSYHLALDQLFVLAAADGGPIDSASRAAGRAAAGLARAALLDHVLYPYDHLLGQWKSPRTIEALAAYARGQFARGVVSLGAAGGTEQDLMYAFDQVLGVVLELERAGRRTWHDSRLVWLPLQLGLRPEDHDTQAELDEIVSRVTAEPFTDGNRVWYLVNDQFQAEALRSIERAEDYHVLWIHDFHGRNAEGQLDTLSLRYVVQAYLSALTRAARAYDVRQRMPLYLIFLDQHYYEASDGRVWLNLLERPLDASRIPGGSGAVLDQLRMAQRDLRDAVAGSRLLQAEARQYGDEWLRNQVKVQVNITNPVDPSFRSRQILPLIGFPDDLMRDHRKLLFYDLSESDPYRGLAIYTGMGIGEQYAGPGWEDRAIMVQGPAVLSLKDQARRLLLGQGIPPDRIPYPLRPRPLGPDYARAVAAEIAAQRQRGQRDQRAMELHNQTGFGEKQISAARAALYELMPEGSVIIGPDAIWANSLYASLLTGSALRGCRALVIAPSLPAAPSTSWPSMVTVHDLLARLIVVQQELGPELEAAGGMVKTGIYNPGIGVQDIGARFARAYRNGRQTPFLRRFLPIDPSVDTMLVHLDRVVPPDTTGRGTLVPERIMPKLHLKATFFASRQGWDSLVARPEMAAVLQAYLGQLVRSPGEPFDAREAAAVLAAASQRTDAAFRASLPPADRERLVYYLLIGSANADYRSMLMDGEASMLLSGWSGMVGLIDFSLISGLSVWIDDLEMLDALLPPASDLQRGVARRLRPAL